ncbi:MAG: glutamine-hydrolyzing carbamoyl-phosphate synthase small subunit [bacterium]|nr:glutamine-hydrolyzing carbamoyl-phosphate synthase small subunit [bacterium]
MALKKEKATLVLTDGTILEGWGFGALHEVSDPVWGEVVFNTSIFGYQEIITDPSYAGQIMCFTNPHIGNVGCNSLDQESNAVHTEGLIIRDLSKVTSNFRAEMDLQTYLNRNKRMGLYGIDTRYLVKHLRDNGSQIGVMAVGDRSIATKLLEIARSKDYSELNFVERVSCKESYEWSELPWDHKLNKYKKLSPEELKNRPHVVAIDCGVKFNILRLLTAAGFRVTVAPCTFSTSELIALKPNAIFLSNGPGDPGKLGTLVATTKELLGKYPMFGICLGHQLIGQAIGGTTFKLKYGHRGGNHPVRNELIDKIEISVQNHGYAVKSEGLPKEVVISHLNLNDQTVEGLDLPHLKAFSVQYHPESSPGPHDAQYLFKRFYEMVVNA